MKQRRETMRTGPQNFTVGHGVAKKA